jgi:hypothetical protein
MLHEPGEAMDGVPVQLVDAGDGVAHVNEMGVYVSDYRPAFARGPVSIAR